MKKILRLTEGDLHNFIEESIKNVLSELDWKTYASAARKNDEFRANNPHTAHQWNRSYDFRNAARDAFDKKYGLEGQYDKSYGGEKGAINLDSMDDFSVSGSRDHDFGDENPHRLNHNVYHLSKKYGQDGGYGRTRMWDYSHDTTPEEFYGDKEMGRKFRDAEKDAEDFNSGKSHYVKGKGWSNESKQVRKSIKEAWKLSPSQQYDPVEDRDEMRIMNKNMPNPQEKNESFKNNQGYSHFAVNKATNKIVNGWDYSEYDPSELRQFKKDYFDVDLVDNDLNPRQYKIVTGKYLLRQGIDPNDNNNWANS